jgi:hypothetical protein
MPAILRFCLRLAFVAAGLLLVAGVALVSMLLLAAWTLRATWRKLTGQPAAPFVVRFGPRQAFHRAWRAPARGNVVDVDVVDVEARRLSRRRPPAAPALRRRRQALRCP